MADETSIPGLDALSKAFGLAVKDFLTQQKEAASDDSTKNGVKATNGDTNGQTNGDTETKESKDESASEDKKDEKKEEPVIEPGSIGSAHNIYRVKDKDGEYIWSSEYPKDIAEAAENDETAKYAVVVRSMKSNDSRKKLEAHSIIVQSQWLKTALSDVLKDYPGVSCELLRLVFDSPFQPFIHRWPQLLQYAERNDLDAITKEHLTLLVNILKEEMRDNIMAFENYLSKGITTFEHVWMLFQPGSLVVSAQRGPLSIFELAEAEYVSCQGNRSLRLECNSVDWDGEQFGRYTQYLSVPEFKGTEKITSLPAFPLALYPNKAQLKKDLISRGRKFEALAGHHFKAYNGVAITWDSEGRERAIHHNGRVVVDCKSFDRYSPYSRRYIEPFSANDAKHLTPKDKPLSTTVTDTGLPEHSPDDEEGPPYEISDYLAMLCMSRVRGYSLATKRWLDFFVSTVEEITWNTRAFDSLVLPEDQKELILSFTESQVLNRRGFDDVVSGKGMGIIILLSGRPGIGKTLTAESVAEAMKRPLHTISSGDLGSSAWDIEQKLQSILDLVGRWNAVLLLDECDVFLEARSTHDLDRNAMVSTFLRTLEYYNGILFMTTNRADNIDPAFESRIHVSMQYPDLTVESRKKIWGNFLATQNHALTDSDLNELAEIDLNGRQIKNILKTSHLLASRKKRKLAMDSVETVLKIENRRPERKTKV